MDVNKIKEGVSIKEIEAFTKKYRFEIIFCVAFVLSSFFSFVMFGPAWSMATAALGGILGMLAPSKTERTTNKILRFIFKQEKIVQMVLAGVTLILSIFIPPLIFFFLGLHGGSHMYKQTLEAHQSPEKTSKE